MVALSKDALGRTVIEVKKDGDFRQDMVLVMPVRLVELESGEVVVGGITAVSFASDTLTLFMEDVSVGGVVLNTEACGVILGTPPSCARQSCTKTCSLVAEGSSWRCDCTAIVQE